MKTRLVAAVFLAALMLFSVSADPQAGPEGAREILEQTLSRDYQDMELQVHLVKVSRTGRERPLDLVVKLKKTPEVTKTLAVFTSPPEVEGISSLSWDYSDPARPSDRWFKLSGLQYAKCRGQACQDMEERFGFSMEIFAIKLDDAEHELAGEEQVDGAACYKIESRAREQDNPEGALFVTWVDKEKYVARKIEIYDQNDHLFRSSSFSEFQKLGDHWWETKGELKELDSGKALRFEIKDFKLNAGLPDQVFEKPQKFTVKEDE